jgi:hypothetical protein
MLSAVIEETCEGFVVLMGYFVGADVPSLGEAFLADVAREGLLARVSSLMSLYDVSLSERGSI